MTRVMSLYVSLQHIKNTSLSAKQKVVRKKSDTAMRFASKWHMHVVLLGCICTQKLFLQLCSLEKFECNFLFGDGPAGERVYLIVPCVSLKKWFLVVGQCTE